MATTKDGGTIESVRRSMEVLELIEDRGGAGVTELANELD